MRVVICLLLLSSCEDDRRARRRDPEPRHQAPVVQVGPRDASTRCVGPAPDCLPAAGLIDTTGHEHTTADLDGSVVVLNFWASWCKPCEAEAPVLSTIHDTYQGFGVTVLGVDNEQLDPAALDAAVRRLGISYPVVPLAPALTRTLGMPTNLPTTFIYDQHGTRRATKLGAYGLDELKTVIDRLLAEP